MTHRERILAAIDRAPLDRIPTDYWGTAEVTEKLMKHLGVKTSMELWAALDIDKIIGVMPPFLGALHRESDTIMRDSFGVGLSPRSYGKDLGTYWEVSEPPLAQFKTVDEIRSSYHWPDPNGFDFSEVAEKAAQLSDYAIQAGYMAPFYIYTNLRGMEQTYIDLGADEEMAHYVIGEIHSFLMAFHKHLFEAGAGKIDVAQVTDDYGSQHGLLISVDMFDKYFRAPFKESVALAKSYDIRIFHHDDGAIREMIPVLRDLGIEILNPIQWRLPGMDLKELKADYGSDICFHGAIDNQRVLPFGTVDEVREEVRLCIDTLASDGTGYILAPCHNIQANTPVENIAAMYTEANDYGVQG